MGDEQFAEMFERYLKSPRGVKFLNNYFATVIRHCEVDTLESECFGTEYEVFLPSYTDDVIHEELNKKEK